MDIFLAGVPQPDVARRGVSLAVYVSGKRCGYVDRHLVVPADMGAGRQAYRDGTVGSAFGNIPGAFCLCNARVGVIVSGRAAEPIFAATPGKLPKTVVPIGYSIEVRANSATKRSTWRRSGGSPDSSASRNRCRERCAGSDRDLRRSQNPRAARGRGLDQGAQVVTTRGASGKVALPGHSG